MTRLSKKVLALRSSGWRALETELVRVYMEVIQSGSVPFTCAPIVTFRR